MPEYLAPGVYIEEVDTGSKPIEGVSTSTAGMVGVTERGPINVPMLITSVGEFRRWYGGQLRAIDFPDHCYFPHAIEGFFSNGGKRVYVVRALDDGAATRAFAPLFDRGDIASHTTRLVRSAGEGTGTPATPPGVVMLEVGALAAGDWIRIGDGSDAEYRQFTSSAGDQTMVVVQMPLSHALPSGATADQLVLGAPVASYTLVGDGNVQDTSIVVDGLTVDIAALAASALAGVPCIELGGVNVGEYRLVDEATQQTVVSATNSTLRLTLDAGLQLPHVSGTAVAEIDLTGAPANTAAVDTGVSGDPLLYVDNRAGNLDTRANLLHIHEAGATIEVKRIGELDEFDFVPGAYHDLAVGTLVEAVDFVANRTVAAGAVAPFSTFDVATATGLVAGQRIVIDPLGANETVTIQSIAGDTLTVTPNPAADPSGLDVEPAAKALTAAANAGRSVLALDDRMGIGEETVLQVGSGISAEFVTVVSLPATSLTAPNAGNVVVTPALSSAAAAGAVVRIVEFELIAGRQPCVVAIAASAGDEEAFVSDGDSFAATETIRVTTGTGQTTYHVLTGSSGPATPQMVQLGMALARSHPAGSPVVQRDSTFDVQALDAGIWGNRLRISVQDETQGLVGNTTLATVVNPTTIRLASAAGVQAGTVLEFYNTGTGGTIGDPVKVSNINRASNSTITIQGAGLSAPQSVPGLGVRSREFRLSVLLLRLPDSTTPTRDDQIIDREEYRNLSMDPRHSNYIEKAIGDIDGALRPWDRRPEGPSLYIRVRDLAPDLATEESVRLGPEALLDTLRTGRIVPAKHRLDQVAGSDSIASLADTHYIGLDNADPDLRTGLHSLLNVEDVSIVAVPSQTSSAVQQAVIDHCETMRYRFAVLDSRREPSDTLTDVQDQRQQFDTKYAALYYPWLSIPDPYPASLASVQEYAIPPSGHMIGVYARTDIERGVHKAPANEVVRGIVGLRRNVNKEQQDILNPFPVNINVIRDFRNNNRGIRVYGGRCITSDSDWKYVNVRRLTIFIEHSLERGLQWVVFEPNAEALWARVTRSVKNFLTTVWRNGALEGTKVEEAFFVKCDRTTMTQTDIDSGRLIVLIGIAPVKPAEFVIVRIGLWTARSDE